MVARDNNYWINFRSTFVMNNYRPEEKLKQPLIGNYVKASGFRMFREFRNVLFLNARTISLIPCVQDWIQRILSTHKAELGTKAVFPIVSCFPAFPPKTTIKLGFRAIFGVFCIIIILNLCEVRRFRRVIFNFMVIYWYIIYHRIFGTQ